MTLEDKICEKAVDLWEKYLYSGDQSQYQAYLDHVHSCPACFKKAKELTG